MSEQKFVLNHAVPVEETRYYEFKEIKGSNPVDTIKNTADEYVVAFLNSEGGRIYWGIRDSDRVAVGVNLNFKQRDDLRRVVSEKLAQIQPSITPTAYRIIFHDIYETEEINNPVADLFVVEIVVPRVFSNNVYFTGSNIAFVKTDGGKKKLSGTQLNDEILRRLKESELHSAKPDASVNGKKELSPRLLFVLKELTMVGRGAWLHSSHIRAHYPDSESSFNDAVFELISKNLIESQSSHWGGQNLRLTELGREALN